MRKWLMLFVLLLVSGSLMAQNTITSPEEFLGYPIGSRFTRHHQIVDYFKLIAKERPDWVTIQPYGTTNEGRELMVAIIANPENHKQLEEIRKNNLRLTGLLQDIVAPVSNNVPPIVWLSYNVHGNEAASSEAAMLTLYTLLKPDNKDAQEWLQHEVIIMDPCINPDGRDRYINWYNSVVGVNMNVDVQSREHAEPWPGGRTNHYNFDLNRDWAWQTQIETQQRLNLYQQWMPEVHVDYHEQGFNEPYYFAPAAEPYHEVITKWQRDFQVLIGKNNASYFDKNGWLYFTKERFDLFYPSYGDTYPLYNGAIGMTFEQGGIRAGLGVINDDGDTLTLRDRVMHHFTTGISTVQVSALQHQQLIDNFKKYYENNNNAANSVYKTYVVSSNDLNKINAVKKLLDNNRIEYGVMEGNYKGYHYVNNAVEDVKLQKYQLAVSMYQPKSSLARVLFEPKSKFSDSATYDITAWSIPYTFGLDAYAINEKITLKQFPGAVNVANVVASDYGYIIPYQSFNAAKLLAYLIKNKVKVRVTAKPITYNNITYPDGTLLVLKTSNDNVNWVSLVQSAATLYNITPVPVNTGLMQKGPDFGSPDIQVIHAPKVALITGEQSSATDAGEVWNYFDKALQYPLTLLNAVDLYRLNLSAYTVIIIPDGYYRVLNDKAVSEKLKNFVQSGGKLITLQNATAIVGTNLFGLKLKRQKTDDTISVNKLPVYDQQDRDRLSFSIPGSIYSVQLDNTNPLAYGYDKVYYTLKQNDHVYEYVNNGWNVGTIADNNYVAGFVGNQLKDKIKNGVLFGTQPVGKGIYVFMADDPIFRMFWENGKLMFANAVFMVN
ncbi:MAG: zinc carboxypeptidase [Hydrotalea sp. AMD]|uniref:M14 family metallopeptidase n=1 Tax=Hydrotalea sp. AMD TaxID=2501297 RepID=UPI000945AD04|nr:M14 family metallopeptidase [Hydrotalea sp. AMD]RWZ90225.1 MAG: zinc carboxypeptidase [Hydrotalea sp. AMD]